MTDEKEIEKRIATSRRRKATAAVDIAIEQQQRIPAPTAHEPNHVTARRARAGKVVSERKGIASHAKRDDLLANHVDESIERTYTDETPKI